MLFFPLWLQHLCVVEAKHAVSIIDEITAGGQVYVGVPQFAVRDVGSFAQTPRVGDKLQPLAHRAQSFPPGFSSLSPRQRQKRPVAATMADYSVPPPAGEAPSTICAPTCHCVSCFAPSKLP